MFDFLKRLFRTKREMPDDEADAKLAEDWYEMKSNLMQEILGPEHDIVMHAIIPYAIGGALDLYYYPNCIQGTAIATKELCEIPGQGSSNEKFASYELAMFTRHALNLEEAKDSATPFGKAHSTINTILNHLAPYSAAATLNPRETCEFPAEMEGVDGKCLIFDVYGPDTGDREQPFGILTAIEVFRSEMEFARIAGGAELISRLKHAGHYPYSDLEREAVA